MRRHLVLVFAIGFHIFLGLVYGGLYHELSGEGFADVNIKIRDAQGVADIRLPRRENYLLKTWGDGIPEVVTWNGARIIHAYYRPRKQIREFYYWIMPSQVLTDEPNRLEATPHQRFTLRIKNNIAASEFGNIAFRPADVKKLPRALILVVAVILLFLVGQSVTWTFQKFFHVPASKILLGYALSHLPCLTLFVLAVFLGRFLSLEFLLKPISFAGVCILFLILIQIPVVLFFTLRELQRILVTRGQRLKDALIFQRWRALALQKKFLCGTLALCGLGVLMHALRLSLFAEFFANFGFLGLLITTILLLRKCRSIP